MHPPSQEDGLNIGTSRDKPLMMEISCREAHIGEKPRTGTFKTAISTSQISKLAKHRKGRKGSFSRGAEGQTGINSATPEN